MATLPDLRLSYRSPAWLCWAMALLASPPAQGQQAHALVARVRIEAAEPANPARPAASDSYRTTAVVTESFLGVATGGRVALDLPAVHRPRAGLDAFIVRERGRGVLWWAPAAEGICPDPEDVARAGRADPALRRALQKALRVHPCRPAPAQHFTLASGARVLLGSVAMTAGDARAGAEPLAEAAWRDFCFIRQARKCATPERYQIDISLRPDSCIVTINLDGASNPRADDEYRQWAEYRCGADGAPRIRAYR